MPKRGLLHAGRFWVSGFVLALVLHLVPAPAGQAADEGKRAQAEKQIFTLQELIERALAESPELAQARSEVSMAQSDLRQVKAGYYPQLESTSLVGPVTDAELPIIRNNRIEDPSPDFTDFEIGIFGRLDFTVTQPVYTFGKLSNRKEAALHGLKAKQIEVQRTRADTALRVKQLYYALVLARQGLETADEAEEFFEEAHERIARLLDLGSPNVQESDLYRIEAYRSDAKRLRAEAQKGSRVTYAALKAMINLPAGSEFGIADEELPTKVEGVESQEEYIRNAIELRPELKQLDEGLKAQQKMVEAARSDRYPSFFLALHGSFAGAPGRDELDNEYIEDEFNHAYAGVVAGMKWDFDFGIGAARVDKARAEYAKLLHTKTFAERNIPVEITNLYQDMLQYQAAVEAFGEASRATRKWVVSAFTNFDMGVGEARDILEALERYGHNRGSYLEALYNFNLTLAQLQYAAGKIEESKSKEY